MTRPLPAPRTAIESPFRTDIQMTEALNVKKLKLPGAPTWAAAAIAVLLAGCSVNPVQVTPEEVAQRVQSDQQVQVDALVTHALSPVRGERS